MFVTFKHVYTMMWIFETIWKILTDTRYFECKSLKNLECENIFLLGVHGRDGEWAAVLKTDAGQANEYEPNCITMLHYYIMFILWINLKITISQIWNLKNNIPDTQKYKKIFIILKGST